MTDETQDDELIVCYLLMRQDMASLNPGKGHAQAHHAGTLMLRHAKGWNEEQKSWLAAWNAQAGGFGTVLSMGVAEGDMAKALHIARRLEVPYGVVVDPTYPLMDGDTLHLISVSTCAYIFGPKIKIERACAGLDLHP